MEENLEEHSIEENQQLFIGSLLNGSQTPKDNIMQQDKHETKTCERKFTEKAKKYKIKG